MNFSVQVLVVAWLVTGVSMQVVQAADGEQQNTQSSHHLGAEHQVVLQTLADQLQEDCRTGVQTYYRSYLLTKAADASQSVGQTAIANRLLDACLIHLQDDSKAGSGWKLAIQCAENLGRLDAIETIAQSRGELPKSFHDELQLARFRNGDTEALVAYRNRQAEVLSFYEALAIADTYTQIGKYEECEDFVHATPITEENSPEDMIAIALANIARKLHEEGDEDGAREWAEKAFGIGGRQFYTGYSMEVLHRKLNGSLTENHEKFARRALAYRGHMARELTQHYVSALVENGHFEIAREVADGLEDPKDRATAIGSIILALAERRDFRGAFALVKHLKAPEEKATARLRIAFQLARFGNRDAAFEIADEALKQTQKRIAASDPATRDKDQAAQVEDSLGLLYSIYAVLAANEKLDLLASIPGENKERARRILSGLQALASIANE